MRRRGRLPRERLCGVDVAIECAGREAALDLCTRAVKRTCAIARVGLFAGGGFPVEKAITGRVRRENAIVDGFGKLVQPGPATTN